MTLRVVEAKGKKAAERLLATWIAELESHRTVDPDRLRVAELLDRWLEATRGEMRVATHNSYRQVCRLHLGWRLHRIWGPAWYRQRASEEARLREVIESAMSPGGAGT